MKVLHTADWHLGKNLDNYSRLEEQRLVLAEICEIAEKEKVDAVLIAGDLFDTFNPSNEAQTLFYHTLKRLTANGTRPVVAIAGNHDSPDRIESPDVLARECGIIFAGYPNSEVEAFQLESGLKISRSDAGFVELELPQFTYPLRLILTPYANEVRMRKYFGAEDKEGELRRLLSEKWTNLAEQYCDDKGVNILMTHLFVMEKGQKETNEPDGEKPILHVGGTSAIYTENFPEELQYVALGHLHRRQTVSEKPCPIVYSSSPLAYSFAEAGQTKYVMIAEIEPKKKAKIRKVPLAQGRALHRKSFEEVAAAITWLKENPNSLVELTVTTEEYLTAVDRNAIYEAHDGIITLIPQIKNPEVYQNSVKPIDLAKSTEELFSDYFKKRNAGQEPNAELMDLLKEVLAEKK